MHGNQQLFETAFNFVHFHVYQNLQSFKQIESLGGVSYAETNFPFDADFILDLASSHIEFALSYDATEFDAQQIQEIGGRYERALAAMAFDPHSRYEQTSLLTKDEEETLLNEWSWTVSPRGAGKCLHEIFEEQARRTPEAIAVAHHDERLSYAQLNAKANQLAHYLRSRKIGPESLVGLCMERSIEMIVALFGILKAGGAYVPLDPQWPRERLSLMLEEMKLPVLLTQQHLVEQLPKVSTEVVCLDSGWQAIARQRKVNPAGVGTGPENLAYMIYTSGSTGLPKGTMIQHGSIVNYIKQAITYYDITATDRALQFASISFDTSTEEIFSTLLCGATLMLRTDEMLSSVSTFLRQCEEWQITVLDFPTAYWHELIQGIVEESLKLPSSVRLVTVGGERALPERLAMWREHVSEHVRVANGYGPTEATIVATMGDMAGPKVTGVASREVSIGRAIGGASIYVLDRHLQLAPAGVPGELHVGGAGLARGYMMRSDATAEKFIPHPFSTEPGARLYKTGDLVRYLPGGEIEYLGRIDQQIKLRGFRIELGEIEATLNRHPGVRDSVVLLREDEPGDKRLVAYVVAADATGAETSASAWRSHLKEHLPPYMVPQAFVQLTALPLTTSGKVNRRALPVPETSRPEMDSAYIPPRTEVERLLAEIWQEVLHVESVGVHDDFFDLGGHSLLATQVVSRVRNVMGMELTLRTLFESPTIESLAVAIDARDSQSTSIADNDFDRIDRDDQARLLERLDELSEEEVDRLLPDLLSEMEVQG
jgi:amino acid adenylation domain-containing protein